MKCPAENPLRIVIKVGTGVLTREDGIRLDQPVFAGMARAIARLKAEGHTVIIVSSGAVGAGLMAMGHDERPTEIAELQAFAAIGQAVLMHSYQQHLGTYDLLPAQLLLTYGDLDSEARQARILRTMVSLLTKDNVVPVINENDSVAVEELRFGDNDALSARVASLIDANRLVILTSVDGLLDSNSGGTPSLVAEVDDWKHAESLVESHHGKHSVGGMASKLLAVRTAVEAGIETFITNGKQPERIPAILDGSDQNRTRFRPHTIA